ncbi:MAG: TonB family protein [Idiomarina sp.]|nr:TonB family protein [Idiomarina sp.]
MKRKLIALFPLLALGACASTNNSSMEEFLDLSTDPMNANDYWIVVSRVAPTYPASASVNSTSGCVELAFGISQNGRVVRPQVLESYPKGMFDRAAMSALSKWRYTHTDWNAEKRPILTTVKLSFEVEGGGDQWYEANEVCNFGGTS